MRRLLLPLLTLAACTGETLPPPPPPAPTASASAAVAPPADLPRAPELRLPRGFSPTHYAATLSIAPKDPAFEGVIDIDLQVAEASKLLWLNATGLTVTEAHADAGGRAFPAHTVAGGEEFLGFAFDEPLPVGAARLHVAYKGTISNKDDRGLFVEEEEGASYVFSQFESTEARRAFPCFDEPSFKVPWQVTLKVPDADVALSNTPVASESREGGSKIVKFAETKPLPSYLVAFAVGPFDLVDAGRTGHNAIPVRIATPHGQGARAAYAASTVPAIVARLEDIFGVPYPYEKLDFVAVPRLVTFGAMENPGLITFNAGRMLARPEEDNVTFRVRFAGTAAHELGHHWFGDLATTAWWDDIWLNEAFATWTESKVLVPMKPEWHYELQSARYAMRAMNGDALVSARRIRQPIVTKDDIENAFDEITYSKGATVIAMFESFLGPDRFRKGVHRYLTDRAHKTATAADFLAALDAETGREIGPAFSSFLDQPGVPIVSAELQCNKSATPAASVALSQERFFPVGSEGGTAATWKIPVCVRWGKGKDQGRSCTLLSERTATLPLPEAKGCPEWVLPNDGAAGYYHVAYTAPAVGALLKGGGKELTLVDRLALIRDLHAAVTAGKLPVADALGRLPDLMKDTHPSIVRGALDLVNSITDPMIPAADHQRFARFVDKTFGARAKAVGWQAKKGEDEQTRFLRPVLLALVADRGEDAALVEEAVKLSHKWLDDPRSIDDDTVDAVLEVAAQHGDRALFDRMHAEVMKTKDGNRRRHLLGAMAAFRDPAIARAALDIVLGGELDARDASELLWQDPRMHRVVFAFMKEHFDALIQRLPAEWLGYVPYVIEPDCDEAQRGEVESFLKPRLDKLPGGPRNLAKVLERTRLCTALKGAQAKSLSAFLARVR